MVRPGAFVSGRVWECRAVCWCRLGISQPVLDRGSGLARPPWESCLQTPLWMVGPGTAVWLSIPTQQVLGLSLSINAWAMPEGTSCLKPRLALVSAAKPPARMSVLTALMLLAPAGQCSGAFFLPAASLKIPTINL